LDDDGCPDDTLDFYNAVRADAEELWNAVFTELGGAYRQTSQFTAYANTTGTPCGDVGPLNASYCSLNEGIYYHRPFVDELMMLVGDGAPAVIVAHEVAHHVQKLDGVLALMGILYTTKQIELQADCYAGVWGRSVALRDLLEEGDLEEAVALLLAFGDDNLGARWFDPNGHGTSLQRAAAFALGFLEGLVSCVNPLVFPAADVADEG